MDEVQLQQILSLCDYMSICRLREKYGRYRPWWSPLGKRLEGWQKAWWRYAQESVLSDVRRRLRKTSWKYFGERLNSRRKYVNLYKTKLKCLRHDQVIEQDVQHELEEMEKETDVDDILNYRSVAERELEDFLVNPSLRYGSNSGNVDKSVEDDRPPSKPRGWLNWLSYGMLGAGGTDDSNQFSGVISDDVIKDIYEATKFHPASELVGDSATIVEFYFSSMKINISEIHTTLRSTELGRAIADLMLKGISIEGKVWEKSAIISASVNSAQMVNPFKNQVVFSTKTVDAEDGLLENQHPSLNIKVDLSPPTCDVNSSVKIVLNPTELICDTEFLKAIAGFLHVLQQFSFHEQRILLSLNGIHDLNSRLMSKIGYVLSSRKKMVWDINLFNTVINIPRDNANTEGHDLVMEIGAISFKSKSELDSSCSDLEDGSHLLNRHVGFGSGTIRNTPMEIQLQDLYDHFEIQINDTQVILMAPSFATIPLIEKFSASANLVGCILLDEPTLKGFEVHVQVPSLVVHFSASSYGEIMGFVSRFSMLLPPSDSKASLELTSNGLNTSVHPWFSINTSLDAISLLVNLEDSAVDGCTLNLYCRKLDVWCDRRDLPECWASVQACRITASSTKDDCGNLIVCSAGSMWGSESLSQQIINLETENGHLGHGGSILEGCIVLHFEAARSAQCFLQKCTIYASDLDIHCYPFIVGQLVGFLDKLVLSGVSDTESRKPHVENDNSSSHGFMLEKCGLLNENGSYKSPSIPLDHIPLTKFENLLSLRDLQSIVEDMRLKLSNTLYLTDQKLRNSKFSLIETPKKFSAPLGDRNIDADSSIGTSTVSDLLFVNLNLGSIKVHFHDSSCIIGTVMVPLAKSLLTISADCLDMVCSTEGVVLSSSWWSQIINEFLWGPVSSNVSPILNFHMKKGNTSSGNSRVEMSFHIQQVSCMLPPEFLAMLISYFSLPDWGYAKRQPTDTISFGDSSTSSYEFNLVDCNIITPANSACSEVLRVNIRQLCVAFSQDSDKSSLTKGIPSACCIGAGQFSDRNHCLDFSGCDLSLSLLILEKDIANPLNRCQNLTLIASLSADVWVRIPYDFDSDLASYPICIMAMVNDCQVDAEEYAIAGFKALGYVIDQFSLVDEASNIVVSDVPHFLQAKKQMAEYTALPSKTSNATFSEMRFCVNSLSLRLHRMKRDSTCSELIADAEMQFLCSLSMKNGTPQSFNISFSSLALFSLINSVVLAEFVCLGSGSSVLDMILSVSDYGENRVVVSFPCLDVWLHLFDWNEVIGLLSLFSEQLSILTSEESAEGTHSGPVDKSKMGAGDGPNLASENISKGACFFIALEHVGLAVHFPAVASPDTYSTFGGPHFHAKQTLGENCGFQSGNQNCFFSVSLQIRNTELVADGKTVKLIISCEDLNGVLKLFKGNSAQTWPLFQLSKIHLEAEIFKYETEDVHMKLLVQCDNLNFSFSDHILYLFQFTWFKRSGEMPSPFNFKRMDLNVQLRKFSLLLTDWKRTSNGPLLEFLVRNSIFMSTVLWEPLVEPWKLQLSMSRKQDERALFSGAIMTDIYIESKTHLNLNLNESIIEVVLRAIEMITDAWSLMEISESPDFSNSPLTKSPETRRYAPYMLQNLTSLPLVFCVCQRQLGADDLDVSPSKGVLQPGSSALVYINESPQELLFRYRPAQSSDRLNDKQLLEAAHRYVTFQLEGTSVPSAPISMDLVGRRYFEVDFSKSSHVSEVYSDANSVKRNRKVDGDGGGDATRGFAIPVVIDVSVQRFTKLMRLFSTVVIINATSVALEVRFDIPFGVAPKILGPIFPGQEFPLPLHLAEAGCMRWRPLGDSYLWSEAYNVSSIISQDARIGFLRNFVCYPSHPSNEAFRCCISVNGQCLPPVGKAKMVYSSVDVDSGKQSQNVHSQPSNNLVIPRNRFLYQVMLTSPFVLKNYLMNSISVTLEDAGVTRTAFLSEVETPFYNIDSSHDLSITLQMKGFRPSTLKYPRVESFSEKAKFSGTKFSTSEIIRFDPEFSDGPLFVTMEKVMDAVSGAREILMTVPFLLYNCTGYSLILSNSVNEMKRYGCIIPSCYDLDEQKVLVDRKDGLGLICSDKNLSATGSTSSTNLDSPDFVKSGSRKVTACLFSPDPHSYSGEVTVKLSRYLPSVLENIPKRSWSAPFSLVPPTGSTTVLVPQPSMASGCMLSVSAMAAPFSGRTKIITFQPRYVIANACTKNLCYKQKGTHFPLPLKAGQLSYIQWMDTTREFLLSVRFDEPGWEWSGCFLPEQLGDTQVKVRNYMTTAVSMMRVEVRSADVSVGEEKIVGSTSGNSGTNLILLSDDDTGFMPYRIDNHSRERLRIYQPKCESFETVIHPYTSSPYAWDEPCYPHRLNVEVPGERILGSYAIDDAPAHSLVYLPATSEKPERKLLISVHSEGAIKVLSIIDSSYHVLNDLKSLHVPQLKDKGKQTRKYESFVNYTERLSLDIPFLGISLMNSHPEELLFACAKNSKVNFVQSLDRQQFSFQIASLQIDNQLHTTPYPVILSFNCVNRGSVANQMKSKDNSAKLISGSTSQIASSNLHEPVFSLAVAKWRNTDTSLVSFESISLRIADFYLEIEQEIVLRLFEFCKTASSRLQNRVFQNIDSSQNLLFSAEITGEISRNAQYSTRLDEKHLNFTGTTLLTEDYKRSCLLPHVVPIGAPWQKFQLSARKQKKIYVELFDMEPIKLTLSFSSSPWILRNGVITSGESLIHRGLMALADVEGAKIYFKQLVLSHQIASWESIQEILVSHYTRQFLHEMYKVFGSAGVIGNPVGFARSLGLGIKDFFSLPIWSVFQSPSGLITGMAQGTTSLLSNTVYAISDATSQFSKAAHKGIVAFTFDDQTATMIKRQQKGMSSQSKGVINEFLEGLTGVLQSPIKGAEKHGLPGVLSGIALGVTGLVARPTASILEVTGKTAQSIRNRSRIYQMGYRCFRVRLPRPLSAESPLKPYSWEEAVGTHVLAETDMKLRDEMLVMCKALKECGQYVLITGRLILVVSCSSLIDLGKPNFEGVPADPKWVLQSEIRIDTVILADNDGEIVHIVGSGSDTSFRQNLQQQKRGNDAKGKLWNNCQNPLPLFQTNLEFRCPEEADEFLRVLMCMIERGKEQGWGSVYVLHQSNIK
ncbi:Vacuolar protein sorting-associated protein 13 [Sesamum alatum]|uniref:Vacuolar protein sorting-associated protein 13 n=1 Tax=Sesamum alatum TaxID=300844 RepID=A0AAE2CWL8_9LAMI|nr:Vacuolar protein sorting-associated protein 13 [Sesamum alatum]